MFTITGSSVSLRVALDTELDSATAGGLVLDTLEVSLDVDDPRPSMRVVRASGWHLDEEGEPTTVPYVGSDVELKVLNVHLREHLRAELVMRTLALRARS